MIPKSHRDVFEAESYGHFATTMPDGSPHVTPVWVDHEGGEYVLVNTARGHRKEKNLRRDPRAAVSVTDPEDPYRYVCVRGPVELTADRATEHVNELARRYLGVDEYPNLDEESRVIVRIAAENVVVDG